MQITTLGGLAVDGHPVPGRRLAALVRALVDGHGAAVSVARLTEAVWSDDEEPGEAAGAVQALVSRARRLGLAIVAVPGGYRLPLDDLQVDTATVGALVERAAAARRAGDVATALSCTDQARALLPPTGGDDDDATARLVARVTGERAEAALAALAAGSEAAHVVGLPGLVDELRALAAHRPPDEPLIALLVRLLAAQGREAEALELVETLRTDLADRYGTDPSPVLARVHLALVRGELAAPLPLPAGQVPAVPTPAGPRATAAAAGPAAAMLARLPAGWRRPAAPLVGRNGELAAVEAALATAALVSVVGTGGAGKTRLVAEVARRAVSRGTPVRVVELAGVHDGAEVAPAVVAAVGGSDTAAARPDLVERHPLAPADRLRAAAGELHGFLVLDNCEHVLAAAADVAAALLAVAAPDVVVLTTSRAPLGLVGEVVVHLPALPDDEALALLAARARAGREGLGWDADAAAALCRRLDNLPLALELAAARLRSMPVADVLTGLSDRFGLLDDALRGLPERQSSLWAMVDWSHELLDADARTALIRLAVFPAPFTADAAEQVAGLPAESTRRALAVLVEQSLLGLDDAADGPARYRMLETVREYGRARLDATGDTGRTLDALVAWAARAAPRLAADVLGRSQLAALAVLRTDHDTFVAALRRALDSGEESRAVDVALGLLLVWTIQGQHAEAPSWGVRLLDANEPARRVTSALLGTPPADTVRPNGDRAALVALLVLANAAGMQYARVAALAVRVLRRLVADPDSHLTPGVRALSEAMATMRVSDPDATVRATALLVAADDTWVRAIGLLMSAALADDSEDREGQRATALASYDLFERAGNVWGMGMAAQAIGQWTLGRPDGSGEEWLARGMRLLEQVGAYEDAHGAHVALLAHRAAGGDDEARAALDEMLTSGARLPAGDAAQAHLGLASAHRRAGRIEQSVRHASAVAALTDDPTMPPPARVMFAVITALHLLRSAAHPSADADAAARATALAAQLLTGIVAPPAAGRDLPALGAFALAAAQLARGRRRPDLAAELWALGARLGAPANLEVWAPGTLDDSEAPDDERAGRVTWLERWHARPVAEAARRVQQLAADQTFLR